MFKFTWVSARSILESNFHLNSYGSNISDDTKVFDRKLAGYIVKYHKITATSYSHSQRAGNHDEQI